MIKVMRCYERAIWHTTVHKRKKKESIKALDAIPLTEFQSYIYESELSED